MIGSGVTLNKHKSGQGVKFSFHVLRFVAAFILSFHFFAHRTIATVQLLLLLFPPLVLSNFLVRNQLRPLTYLPHC
jgi:hypothetical protein